MARRAGWAKQLLSPTHHVPLQHLDDDVLRPGIDAAGRRSSFSYFRLPEQLLRVSVLKLDGSSFDVEVARTASVMEPKMRIEDIFNKPAEEGGCSISWFHVWGHFCLCYNEHKLTDDVASLRTFGVKDGDQLYFIRHLSPNQNLNRRRSRNQGTHFEQHRKSLSWKHTVDEVKESDKDTYKDYTGSPLHVDHQNCVHRQDRHIVVYTKPKSGHFFQGCHSKQRSPHKTKAGSQVTKFNCYRRRFFWAIC